ncbi:unnamed protein product [Pieris macdunnoughi]|uniref:Uncharacterized protein n=1 Tax=Pieris macdunnoughi TaxID=345717 RepID=A0A821XBY5_9NEOP|nr:unnamed protein product [Pieris macdunnoughi]
MPDKNASTSCPLPPSNFSLDINTSNMPLAWRNFNTSQAQVGMCMKWLYSNAPPHVKKHEMIFPMVGHSLPSDRVFAKIEKEVKKMSVICDPQMYVNLFTKHVTIVKHLGVDVEVYDWKNKVTNVCKPPGSWHFKIYYKRFVLHKGHQNVSVQGEENYRN